MTKQIKKLPALILMMAFVAMTMSGCTTYNNFKNAFLSDGNVETEKTIKIGVYEPMSGSMKKDAYEEIKGIELAHSIRPEACGKKIELIYGDNKSDMYAADDVINEMLNKSSPSIILGSYGETLTLVASKPIKATNTPAITISSTNPLITSNNEYYFCASYSETKQGDVLADYAVNQAKVNTVATVTLGRDDTTVATLKRFTNKVKSLTENDKSVAGTFPLPTDTQDYSQTIELIRASGAKAVFLAVSPDLAKSFLEQCVDKNLTHPIFLGTRDWNDEDFVNFVKSQPKIEVAFISEVNATAESAKTKEFNRAYKAMYGEDSKPSQACAIAYDAYMIAVQALEDANKTIFTTTMDEVGKDAPTDAEALVAKKIWKEAYDSGIPAGQYIKDALYNITDYEGASGTINFGGSNEVSKEVSIIRINEGAEVAPYNVDKDVADGNEVEDTIKIG